MDQDPLILVDVMNLVFRQHFAHANLSADDDAPTGMTYGFIKTVDDLRRNVSRRLVFCWDHGIPVIGSSKPANWRDRVVSDYKATRKPNPAYEQIIPQLLPLSDLITTLGYEQVMVPGLEADDTIGIIAANAKGPVLVFSTDRDFYQLLTNPNVAVLVPKKEKGGFRRIRAIDVKNEFGVPVDFWPEYLALGGDKSDDIKPIRGMGPKAAIKLIGAGIDPEVEDVRELDPIAFVTLTKYQKEGTIEDLWKRVRACYSAALIPTDPDDERLAGCWSHGKYRKYRLDGKQRVKNVDAAVAQYAKFCANRDMPSLMMMKDRLFEF